MKLNSQRLLTLCLLFGLFFLSSQLDQFISLQMEAALKNPEGVSNEVWFWGMMSFLNAFLFPPFFTLIFVFKYYFNLSLYDLVLKIKYVANHLYIETLRSWGKIFQWSFALIIPGLLRWFQYLFVPLVVSLDKAYDEGQIDALEHSRKLYRRRWIKLTLIILAAWIIYPMLMSSFFDEYRLIWIHTGAALLLSIIDFIVTCLATYWVIKIFIDINKEANNELTLPMERH